MRLKFAPELYIGGEKGDEKEADRRLRRPGDQLCDACHVSKF